jgi:hypothetical protein
MMVNEWIDSQLETGNSFDVNPVNFLVQLFRRPNLDGIWSGGGKLILSL